MASYPKVSIMIATYNQEAYIAQAIESALQIDYPHLEVVVSDDASQDRTFAIAKRYERDPRVRVYRQEKNLGRVGNYRKLVTELAQGEFCVMLDGDDYYTSRSFIRQAVSLFEKHHNLVAVLFGCSVHYEQWGQKVEHLPRQQCYYRGLKLLLDYSNLFFFHGACVYHREKLLSVSPYLLNIMSSDLETFLRTLVIGDVYYLSCAVHVWRIHGENTSFTAQGKKTLENFLTILESVLVFCQNSGLGGVFLKKLKENFMQRGVKVSLLNSYLNDDFIARFDLFQKVGKNTLSFEVLVGLFFLLLPDFLRIKIFQYLRFRYQKLKSLLKRG